MSLPTMTNADDRSGRKRTPWLTGAADGLGLAASPAFAAMALMSAAGGASAICAVAPGLPRFDGMVWMYLLMSLFHLPCWLKLASGQRRHRSSTPIRSKGD